MPSANGNAPLGSVLLCAGAVLAIGAALSLGRSFGIRPVLRQVQTGGLYRAVRHPLYASYMVMDVGELVANLSFWNAGVAMFGAALFVWRAKLEEGVLCRDPAYAAYVKQVSARFVPAVV